MCIARRQRLPHGTSVWVAAHLPTLFGAIAFGQATRLDVRVAFHVLPPTHTAPAMVHRGMLNLTAEKVWDRAWVRNCAQGFTVHTTRLCHSRL